MASRNQSAPEQPETTPEPEQATEPVIDVAYPAVAFQPIEVPVVDGTVGFTPISVTPIDQAIQAASNQEA